MNGFLYPRRYEVFTYPTGEPWLDGWGGFQLRIMVNPTGLELHHERALYETYLAEKTREAEGAYWQYVAERIPEWNLEFSLADGSTRTVPPPAENWESIYELDPIVMGWVSVAIRTAHLPKARARIQGQDLEIDAGTLDTTPPTPLRPPKSAKRSASA